QSPQPIDLYEASLETARFREQGGAGEEGAFVQYLHALFDGRSLDLVVSIGGPAARFVQQHRPQLFPSTPMLISATEQRRVDLAALTAGDTVVAATIDFPTLIDNILRVRPQTTHIAVALGASPLEKFWVEELRREFQQFMNRVTFEWFNELTLEQMQDRAAA